MATNARARVTGRLLRGGGQIGKSGVKIAVFDPILTQIGSKSVKAAENFRPAAGHKTVKVGSAEIWAFGAQIGKSTGPVGNLTSTL